jgi:DNA-binding NarL/FixJ family response regulator
MIGQKDTAVIKISVTEWEKNAVKLLAEGKAVPEIADQIQEAETRKVEYKISKLKTRLGCETAAQLVAFFLRNKLID